MIDTHMPALLEFRVVFSSTCIYTQSPPYVCSAPRSWIQPPSPNRATRNTLCYNSAILLSL